MTTDENATRLTIQVQPRARRTEVAGILGDAIRLRVTKPPVDGAANAEVVRFLADRLGLPRSRVRIVTGEGGRRKVIEVLGITPATVIERLGIGARVDPPGSREALGPGTSPA